MAKRFKRTFAWTTTLNPASALMAAVPLSYAHGHYVDAWFSITNNAGSIITVQAGPDDDAGTYATYAALNSLLVANANSQAGATSKTIPNGVTSIIFVRPYTFANVGVSAGWRSLFVMPVINLYGSGTFAAGNTVTIVAHFLDM